MEMPIEVLERLNTLPKVIASPEMGLAQLRRESEAVRRQHWDGIAAIEAEYGGLSYDRNKYLSSNVAISKLKLVTAFIDNGEAAPKGHGFTNDEIVLYRNLEEFDKYEALSEAQISECVQLGNNDRAGIFTSAGLAAQRGYAQIESIISSTIRNSDLKFALTRKYRGRLNKIALAASEYLACNVEDGNRIYAQKAKLVESSYIGLVESRLREPQPDLKWGKIELANDLEQMLRELRKNRNVSIEDVKRNIPNGLGITATVEARKMLQKSPSFKLQVKVLSDFRQLFTYGYDGEPLSINDITPHVTLSVTAGSKCSLVLVLASITGWSREAASYLEEDRLVIHNGCVMLVDLQSESVHYGPSAERALEFSPMHLYQVLYYIHPERVQS